MQPLYRRDEDEDVKHQIELLAVACILYSLIQ